MYIYIYFRFVYIRTSPFCISIFFNIYYPHTEIHKYDSDIYILLICLLFQRYLIGNLQIFQWMRNLEILLMKVKIQIQDITGFCSCYLIHLWYDAFNVGPDYNHTIGPGYRSRLNVRPGLSCNSRSLKSRLQSAI